VAAIPENSDRAFFESHKCHFTIMLDRKNSIRQYDAMFGGAQNAFLALAWRRWRMAQRLHRG
ncbi:MAG TPA: hypothetical protein VKH62_12345, partial [Candidatus Binatia bacterium]|nr:hypothetical protein [Candidatus Binatia bacterium]